MFNTPDQGRVKRPWHVTNKTQQTIWTGRDCRVLLAVTSAVVIAATICVNILNLDESTQGWLGWFLTLTAVSVKMLLFFPFAAVIVTIRQD